MTIQIDPMSSPRIITVPETDGASITVQSLVDQIREWEHDIENLSYIKLLSASGKEVLDEATKVGITATLQNAKLKFAGRESPIVCSVRRGNIVAVDVNGYPMDVIEPSTNVTVVIAQSISPSIIYSEDVWTGVEKGIVLNGTSTLINNVDTLLTDTSSILVDTGILEQVSMKRWKIEVESKQLVYYGTTGNEIVRFNLYDRFGEPAVDDIFERVPV